MAFSKLIKCPICGVPNRFGDPKCKICKNALPQEEELREAPDSIQEMQNSARPPPKDRDIKTGRVKRLKPRSERQDKSPQDEPPRVEPPRDGPPRDGPPRDRPPRDRPPRDRPPRDKPPRDRPPRDRPPRDKPPRDRPPRGQGRPRGHGPPQHRPVQDRPPRGDGPPRGRLPGDRPRRRGPARRRERADKPKPGRQENPHKIIAWMCCDPLPPVPLGPKLTLTLGRSDDCDLVLPHKEVSRVHALIKVRGKLVVFEDEGSSNGSYVNKRRVSSCHLKVGDKLVLGPYELEIRSNEEMAARHGDETTKTKAFQITSSRSKPDAVMSGHLAEVPLTELFQALEFNKRTGTLSVFSNEHKGVLVLESGAPVGATFDDLTGEEAVLGMLTVRKGRFSLTSTVEELEGDPDPISTTLTALLFEASRREDEGGEAA